VNPDSCSSVGSQDCRAWLSRKTAPQREHDLDVAHGKQLSHGRTFLGACHGEWRLLVGRGVASQQRPCHQRDPDDGAIDNGDATPGRTRERDDDAGGGGQRQHATQVAPDDVDAGGGPTLVAPEPLRDDFGHAGCDERATGAE
jgi:hypothetical protein